MAYALQFPFYTTANKIFRDVMEIEGTGFVRRWYKWGAVASAAGWAAWCESSDPSKQELEAKWVMIREVPKVSPEFRYLLAYRHKKD